MSLLDRIGKSYGYFSAYFVGRGPNSVRPDDKQQAAYRERGSQDTATLCGTGEREIRERV